MSRIRADRVSRAFSKLRCVPSRFVYSSTTFISRGGQTTMAWGASALVAVAVAEETVSLLEVLAACRTLPPTVDAVLAQALGLEREYADAFQEAWDRPATPDAAGDSPDRAAGIEDGRNAWAAASRLVKPEEQHAG